MLRIWERTVTERRNSEKWKGSGQRIVMESNTSVTDLEKRHLSTQGVEKDVFRQGMCHNWKR